MSDYLERKDRKRGHVWLLVGLVILFIILAFSKIANAAESDSLCFISATDMIQKVDSIEAVCDTVYAESQTELGYIFVSQITCRELIDVVVIARPDSVRYEWQTTYPAQYRKIRGQMVVRWREAVQ